MYADGTGVVGRCTNVEVRQCGWSGVLAYKGGSITLIGAKTTVHHNCTYGRSDDYGLRVFNSSSSTIQLVSPLTKEQVSIDNGGGGNWGAGYQGDTNLIKTIALDNQHEMICERFVSMVRALHPHRASEIAGLVLGTIHDDGEVLNLMEDLDALRACVNAAVLQVAAKVTKVKNRKNKKNKKNKNNKKKKKKKKR